MMKSNGIIFSYDVIAKEKNIYKGDVFSIALLQISGAFISKSHASQLV